MSQSSILRYTYELFYNNLASLGDELKLFTVENDTIKSKNPNSKYKSCVFMEVSDISPLSQAKNSERIVINENHYESPTSIGFIISLSVISDNYFELLESLGAIVRYFKDNNTILAKEEFNWHGNESGKIYIEPFLHKPGEKYRPTATDHPSLSLEYYIEVAINSENGTPFRRVEKYEIHGNVFNEKR
jgi:hypothetical protein